ncbi:MAG TPA: alpha/beta hydrolase [Jatrophihabitans sp.]|nr:alpha/beta hydrolase [Jatrophihabitans sp.]
MPRRPTRTVPTVLLTGPIGGRPMDWPQWLAGELTGAGREVRHCRPAVADRPNLADWLPRLSETLSGLADDGFDVVAHSLGCLLWLHHAGAAPVGAPRPARVALVSPPAAEQAPAEWQSFFPVPLRVDDVRRAADGTVLVGGADDPYCPGGVAQVYGTQLKMAATVLPGAGALTADTGYGPWPAVLDWCGRDNLAFIA